MTDAAKNAIILVGAIGTIVLCILGILDFFIDRWGYLRRFGRRCHATLIRLRGDSTGVTLHIPRTTPAVLLPATTSDGVSKIAIKYIMRGHDQLLAYEVTRAGFPGKRFLVVRNRPNQNPQSFETADSANANARWQVWFQEWRQQPGGFGGASGTGLDGKPPW